ncbi:MAG: dockerin type I domain-containing protein [Defluviitaleaceae bacterium]|nr:dockerin type I domain-containing protein [Defluviitaleaceae bacterium]
MKHLFKKICLVSLVAFILSLSSAVFTLCEETSAPTAPSEIVQTGLRGYGLGDVNLDGVVNSLDVVILSQYLLGQDVEINTLTSDINRDGVLDDKDTRLILRGLCGWENDFDPKPNSLTIIPINAHTGKHIDYTLLEVYIDDILTEYEIHTGIISIPSIPTGSNVRLNIGTGCDTLSQDPTWKIEMGDIELDPYAPDFTMPEEAIFLIAEFSPFAEYYFPWTTALEWCEETANEPIEYIIGYESSDLDGFSSEGFIKWDSETALAEFIEWDYEPTSFEASENAIEWHEIFTGEAVEYTKENAAFVEYPPHTLDISLDSSAITGQNANTWNPVALASSIRFDVPLGVPWTAVSTAPSWLTISDIVHVAPHTNDSFVLNVTENTGNADRTGTVRINVGTNTVAEIFVTQSHGAVLIVPGDGGTFASPPTSGLADFIVFSNRQWTVSTSAPWLTMVDYEPANRTGNGWFTILVDTHLGSASRTGIITITAPNAPTQTITIIQNPGPILISPTGPYNMPAHASTSALMEVTSNRAWTITSSQPSWLSATPTSGTNNGSFRISATANVGNARTGTITASAQGAASRVITVTQEAGNGLVLSGTGGTATAFPTAATVNVISDRTWNTPTSNVPWLTISNVTPTNRNGNGSFVVNVALNPGSATRTGVVTVTAGTTSRTFTVTQTAEPVLWLSGIIGYAPSDSGFGLVEVMSNRQWSVSVSNNATSWLSVGNFNPTNRTGSGSFHIINTENTSNMQRAGTITISVLGLPAQTINVVQDGRTAHLTLSANRAESPAIASQATIRVTSSTTWNVQSSASWLSADGFQPANRNGNGSFRLVTDVNTSSQPRTARLTVRANGTPDRFIDVTQAGAGGLELSRSEWEVIYEASESTIHVTCQGVWNVNVSNNATSWLSVDNFSPANRAGNGSFRIRARSNSTLFSRVGTVTVTYAGITRTITVTQRTDTGFTIKPSFSWNEADKQPFLLRSAVEIEGGSVQETVQGYMATAHIYGKTITFNTDMDGVYYIEGRGIIVNADVVYPAIVNAAGGEIIFMGVHAAFAPGNPGGHASVITFIAPGHPLYNDMDTFNWSDKGITSTRWGGVRYATLGGSSEGNLGCLHGIISDTDRDLSRKRVMQWVHSGIGKYQELLDSFKHFNAHYSRSFDYYFLGRDFWRDVGGELVFTKGYNSNSYARALLNANGIYPGEAGYLPGWETIIEAHYFGR